MVNEKKIVWTKKDLLGLEYLSREEIEHVLYTAASFKEVTTRQIKKVPALRGKTVVNLFYEPSTRTRISFELAAKRLSADVINVAVESSSVRKGETLIDTGMINVYDNEIEEYYRNSGEDKPFLKVKNEMREIIRQKKETSAMDAWINELKNRSYIKVDESVLKEMGEL